MSQQGMVVTAISPGGAVARFVLWVFLAGTAWPTPGADAADHGRNAVIAASVAGSGTRLARVLWTSYLHAGPGFEFAVLDEVAGPTWLRVESCDATWCRVGTDSLRPEYVARANLALPSDLVTALARPSPSMDLSSPSGTVDDSGAAPDARWRCVRSRLAGYQGRGDDVGICSR